MKHLKSTIAVVATARLGEACVSAGVEVDNVIEMLTVLGKSAASESSTLEFRLTLTDLINHILERITSSPNRKWIGLKHSRQK